ncbi:hypothetical protein I8F73_03580 [Enterococcus faecalis]|nr:hypothetical protein [Enterococcus faecalis]
MITPNKDIHVTIPKNIKQEIVKIILDLAFGFTGSLKAIFFASTPMMKTSKMKATTNPGTQTNQQLLINEDLDAAIKLYGSIPKTIKNTSLL